MSKTVAIVLSIIGGLILLALIAVGGAGYWFYQNKEKLTQALENIGNEAKRFGAKTNNEGCLKEALARHKRANSFPERMATQNFLGICLHASEPSPGFCDGAPPQREIFKAADWANKRCSDAGMPGDPGCAQLFSAVQSYCRTSAAAPEK
jgi:hypothetical protein